LLQRLWRTGGGRRGVAKLLREAVGERRMRPEARIASSSLRVELQPLQRVGVRMRWCAVLQAQRDRGGQGVRHTSQGRSVDTGVGLQRQDAKRPILITGTRYPSCLPDRNARGRDQHRKA